MLIKKLLLHFGGFLAYDTPGKFHMYQDSHLSDVEITKRAQHIFLISFSKVTIKLH